MAKASDAEREALRRLVGGLDIPPDSSQFRAVFAALLAGLDAGESAHRLRELMRLAPRRRDPLLAYLLWFPDERVRDCVFRFLLSDSGTLPELAWRAIALAKPLRDRLPKRSVPPLRAAGGKEAHPGVVCADARVSIPDGSGHVTLFLAVERGRTPAIALALMHTRQGLMDVETIPHPTRDMRDRAFRDMCGDLDVNEVRPGDVHLLLRDLLGLCLACQDVPPPGAVDLLPYLWRTDVAYLMRKRTAPPRSRARRGDAGDDAAGDAVHWVRILPLLESWVSASALATQSAHAAVNRLEHVFFRLEEERALWLANVRWSAAILARCGTAERRLARGFAALARHIEQGTPLRDIPFFRQVALRTVMATQQMGAPRKGGSKPPCRD